MLKNENIAFKNLLLLVELALALLGINADVEEVKALKTIEKNQFKVETVRESLLIKTYFTEVFCIDFYSFFCQHNTKLLWGIHQTDKIL